ncbi:hypothetical protein DK847_12960 [Aestuariivirga litoralis]|uniref:Uncharacterized protein n=1 Tax=Aestuariivirga litoralis TaxID=2650924 RepID=A0A2W2AMB1_9HYPH|nr:hypothetical protein [Aestuariivirga litoralis]PZF76695.1 hypothetical protein DK847_12960 [Aestuariivirga litoralis]
MRNKDAKACFPEEVRRSLIEKWHELRANKDQFPIYWEFIHRERNNILKEYEFGAYESIINAQGEAKARTGILYLLNDGETEGLVLRGGPYDGKSAIDVADEGKRWVQSTVCECLSRAGFDPDEEIEFEKFVRIQS